MDELFKVCPACGAEYLPHIHDCADCGTALVLPGQPPPAPTVQAPPARKFSDGLVCIRVADLDWARRLGARLERAGIDHLLEAQETPGGKCCGGAGNFRVLVRPGDAEAAAAVDAEQLRADVPGLTAMPGPRDDPGACPACGDPLPEKAAECPSCGLTLIFEGPDCPSCGEPLPPDAKQCPGCGRATGRQCC